MANKETKLVIITGMSGAGKTVAIQSFEDLGYEDWLEEHILFLNASDEVLVSRYKETRRSHPLSDGGLPLDGIMQEREILNELRGRAQKIIDTSELKPKELREQIIELYAND